MQEQKEKEKLDFLYSLNSASLKMARLDQNDILDLILSVLKRVAPVEAVGIYLLSHDQQHVERFSIISGHSHVVPGQGQLLAVKDSDLGLLAVNNSVRIFDDLPTVRDQERQDRTIAIQAGVRSSAALPIQHGGRILGTLVVDSYAPHQYGPDLFDLLRPVADIAGVYTENQHLLEQMLLTTRLDAALEERHSLARQFTECKEEALQQVAARVDDVLKSLPGKQRLLRPLRMLEQEVSHLLRNTGFLVDGLDVNYAPDCILKEAMAAKLASFEASSSIRVRWGIMGDVSDLPAYLKVGILHLVQDTLSLARATEGVHQIRLRLDRQSDMVTLEIEDDGSGHSPALTNPEWEHLPALYRLRARATQLGGRLNMCSIPNWGTRRTFSLPIRPFFAPAGLSPVGPSNQSAKLRVMIVDERPLYRQALAELVNQQVQLAVVAVAPPHEAQQQIDQFSPDVILIGCASEWPTVPPNLATSAPFIVIGGRAHDGLAWRAAQMGAQGYISQEANVDMLLSAIQRAADGESAFEPNLATQLQTQPSPPQVEKLTGREQEILQLVAQGLQNQEIAAQLVIQESTVRWHVHNVLQKLNARGRTDAVRLGREHGLLL